MTNPTKIAIAAVALSAAVAILSWSFRKPELPGASEPAVVHLANGKTLQTTWQEVFARAQSQKAYLDRGPGGGWMYQTSDGQWCRVTNPGQAVPASAPAGAR